MRTPSELISRDMQLTSSMDDRFIWDIDLTLRRVVAFQSSQLNLKKCGDLGALITDKRTEKYYPQSPPTTYENLKQKNYQCQHSKNP